MIIITGMNRSGTSLVARMLHALGANFGDKSLLKPKDKWNLGGYFENVEVMTLNDFLVLGALGRSQEYHYTPSEQRSPLSRLCSALALFAYAAFLFTGSLTRHARRKRVEMKRLAQKYQQTYLKDTRFSLTLSAWKRTTVIHKALYCYRSPADTVLSLKKMNGVPMWLGYYLWVVYVRKFFKAARHIKITVVKFDNFLDPQLRISETERVYRFFSDKQPDSKECESLIERLGDKELWHCDEKNVRLPKYVQKTYAALERYHAKL